MKSIILFVAAIAACVAVADDVVAEEVAEARRDLTYGGVGLALEF